MTDLSIVCVLDRSGSMSNIMTDMIGSFNAFIDEQKKTKEDIDVTLVSFNWREESIFKNIPINELPELTLEMVKPMGGTALYDALGIAILSSNNPNTIVLIQTDGEENSSNTFDNKVIKEMIKQKEKLGWKFVFIGSDLDSFSVGSKFGVSASSCVNLSGNASFDAVDSVGVFGARGPKGPQGDMGAYGTVLNSAVNHYKTTN